MRVEQIIINNDNVHSVVEYVRAARELNKFTKESFGKKNRENSDILSIAPIIDDLHKEIAILEKKLLDYEKRNHECLEEGGFYLYLKGDRYNNSPSYMGKDKCLYYKGERSYVHILHKSGDGRKLTLEEVNVTQYSPDNIFISTMLKEDGNIRTNISSTEYLDAFYSDRLIKITEDEWNEKKAQVKQALSALTIKTGNETVK
jgi:hypothetical protein